MEQKLSERELLKRSLAILQRGDGYRAIRSFLRSNCDEETEDQIIASLVAHEKQYGIEKKVAADENSQSKFYKYFGLFMMAFGCYLIWHYGWFAVLPITIVGLGWKYYLDN